MTTGSAGRSSFALQALRKRMRVPLAASAALLAAAGIWAGYLQVSGNVHEVVPGVLYRSAQLDERTLADLIARYRIRSVVNLKGARPSKDWYRRERAVTAAKGVVKSLT